MDTNNDVIKSTEFSSSNSKTYRTPKKWHFIASIIEIVLGFVCYALAFLAVLAVAVYIWNGGEVYSVLIVVLYSIYGILLFDIWTENKAEKELYTLMNVQF